MQAQWSEALCLAVLDTFDLKRGNSAAFMPKQLRACLQDSIYRNKPANKHSERELQ